MELDDSTNERYPEPVATLSDSGSVMVSLVFHEVPRRAVGSSFENSVHGHHPESHTPGVESCHRYDN